MQTIAFATLMNRFIFFSAPVFHIIFPKKVEKVLKLTQKMNAVIHRDENLKFVLD